MAETIKIDHAAYAFALRDKSLEELRFIAKDAHAAMLANPDGPKAGYYADEVNYVANEMYRRQQGERHGRV